MGEAVVFGSAVEGLFVRTLGARLDATARDRIREIGIDLNRPPQAAYPIEVWEKAVDWAARCAFPELPVEEAWVATGQAFVAGFGQTLIGRAVLGVGRVVGVERSLKRMTRNLHSVNNFNSAVVEESAPGRVVIRVMTTPEFRELPRATTLPVHYMRGVFQGMAEELGARAVTVQVLELHPTLRDSRFRISWSA
jgi:uncharacterized protein (TIGR02265 family)